MVLSAVEERKKILVIDDEFGPRESVRFLFKNAYNVYCEESVESGIQRLKQESPDVIIMDIKMPEQNGIDGLREIRRIDPDVSVIMLTGFGSLESAQEAMRMGASDYIKKPFDTNEMRKAVEKHIEQTDVARRRAKTTSQLEELNVRLRKEVDSKKHLASLGQASSELVHDLRNPLTVICGYVELLMEEVENPERWDHDRSHEAMEYLDVIAKNVGRCQEMSRMWRDLGKRDPSQMRPCRVADVIEEVAQSCEPVARNAGGRINVMLGPSTCVVLADSGQLFRALQNVVANAIQALPEEGGVVSLTWAERRSAVELRVEDNGCGIREKDLEEVFSPDYTTKGRSGGMGLGLFIARKVIEETHNGTVELTNRPEGGVRATLRLPLRWG